MLSLCLFAVVGLSYHLNDIKCDDSRTEALKNKMGKKIKKREFMDVIFCTRVNRRHNNELMILLFAFFSKELREISSFFALLCVMQFFWQLSHGKSYNRNGICFNMSFTHYHF